MASYSVEISARAEKDIQALDKGVQGRVMEHIQALAVDPYPPGSKKLEGGDGERRVRVGDYRIIYRVNDPKGKGEPIIVVLVLRVRHRREVYR